MSKKIIIFLAFICLSAFALFLKISEFRYAIWEQKQDQTADVIVFLPQPNEKISSPYNISGLARGNYFFEASFPIILRDNEGADLGMTIANAMSDWMTTDYVPFEATMEFSSGEAKSGTLIFKKDNPSGLPQHDKEIRIPVSF